MPSKLQTTKTFRISRFHDMMLRVSPYKTYSGLLIRMLLEAYFDGRLPQIRKEFDSAVTREMSTLKSFKKVNKVNV